MVLHPGKCHCMLIDNRDKSDKMNLDGTKIISCNSEKFLHVLIDKKN